MAASPVPEHPPAKRARHDNKVTEEEDPAVTLFREYLRIPTVSRGDNYQKHYGEMRCTLCARIAFWSCKTQIQLLVYDIIMVVLHIHHHR